MGDTTASQFREPSSHHSGLEDGGEGEETERSIEGFRESDFDRTQFGATEYDTARKIQQWWLMWRFIKWLPERRRYRKWLRDTFEYLEPDL